MILFARSFKFELATPAMADAQAAPQGQGQTQDFSVEESRAKRGRMRANRREALENGVRVALDATDSVEHVP